MRGYGGLVTNVFAITPFRSLENAVKTLFTKECLLNYSKILIYISSQWKFPTTANLENIRMKIYNFSHTSIFLIDFKELGSRSLEKVHLVVTPLIIRVFGDFHKTELISEDFMSFLNFWEHSRDFRGEWPPLSQ